MIKLITSQPNVTYFSGFSGSVGILIVNGKASYLIVDGRYGLQASSQVKKGIKVIQAPLESTLLDEAVKLLKKLKAKEIGYEDDKLDTASFNKMRRQLMRVKFSSISRELRDKRCVKDSREIDLICKAALIADLTYDCVLRIIKPEMTELEISAQIDYLIKTFKGEQPAFETLVSSGAHSAYPHGKPSENKVKKGELIIMDFGARYKMYNSDMTRMVSLGNPSKKQLHIYNAVLNSQKAAIEKIKDGASASDIDKAARAVLIKERLGGYFTHGTGHGIGLQVHEGPRLSMKSGDILKAGMIVTVEPGVYIKGLGGFRVEDMVLVTKGGRKILTKSSKNLLVL